MVIPEGQPTMVQRKPARKWRLYGLRITVADMGEYLSGIGRKYLRLHLALLNRPERRYRLP